MSFHKLLFFILFLFSIYPISSQSKLIIDPGFQNAHINKELEFYEESTPQTIDSIQKEKFEVSTSGKTNFGFSEIPVWFKFNVQSNLDQPVTLVLSINYPTIDFIELYAFENGAWKSIITGDQSKSLNRSYPFRLANIEFTIPPKTEVPIYYRIQTEGSMQAGSTLFTKSEFFQYQLYDNLVFGLCYGSILIIAIFTLILSFFTNDSNFFRFSFYSIFSLIFQTGLSGHYFLLGPTEYPWVQNSSLIITNSLAIIFLVMFSRKFLSIDSNNFKKLYLVSNVIIFISINQVFLLFPFGYSTPVKLLTIIGTIFPIIFLIFGVMTYKIQKEFSKIYTLTIVVVMISATIFGLKTQGIIPTNDWIDYFFPFSNLISCLLFSVGISFRVNLIEKDNNRLLKEYVSEIEEKNKLQDSKELLIKERNRIISELNDATQHLIQAEKLSSLGAMVAGIAHEIANPIQFIDLARWEEVEKIDELEMYLFSLIPDREDTKPFRESLKKRFQELRSIQDRIKLGISKVTEIHKSMRNISRTDSIELQEVDLRDVCDEASVILGSKIKSFTLEKIYFGEHLKLNEKPELADTPKILCKRSQIGQVLMNLISNAADALEEQRSKSNEYEGKIQIHLENSKHGIRISVSDNGSGIPEQLRSKVMDAFFTTKPAGKGTGLGLAICGKIIQQHKGKIHIEDGLISTNGHGAKFVVEIPFVS